MIGVEAWDVHMGERVETLYGIRLFGFKLFVARDSGAFWPFLGG